MESGTMAKLALERSEGHDGARTSRFPGQSGVRDGESAVGSPCHSERSEESRFVPLRERTRAGFFASLRMTSTEASLFDEPAPATDEPRKAQKGALLGETKPLCDLE